MAIDSGWIVAVSSLATIITTGLFSIWSKRIDAKQKLNEHKLTIRSIYVGKKIKAGQAFIGKNNMIVQRYYIEISYLKEVKYGVPNLKNTVEKMLNARAVMDSSTLETNDFTDLFFDLSPLYKIHKEIVRQCELHILEFNGIGSADTLERHELLKEVIVSLTELINSYGSMNDFVREDLAKYDII